MLDTDAFQVLDQRELRVAVHPGWAHRQNDVKRTANGAHRNQPHGKCHSVNIFSRVSYSAWFVVDAHAYEDGPQRINGSILLSSSVFDALLAVCGVRIFV